MWVQLFLLCSQQKRELSRVLSFVSELSKRGQSELPFGDSGPSLFGVLQEGPEQGFVFEFHVYVCCCFAPAEDTQPPDRGATELHQNGDGSSSREE